MPADQPTGFLQTGIQADGGNGERFHDAILERRFLPVKPHIAIGTRNRILRLSPVICLCFAAMLELG